jgi:hypothetical protein
MKPHSILGPALCCLLLNLLSVSALSQTIDDKTLAAQILDASKPDSERDALIATHPKKAGELMAEMVKNLPVGTPDEYKSIPWIWRVAIAAGKRNDSAELKKLLQVSMPDKDGSLCDWQAVVIGGGIINGLSLTGVWPSDRINEILQDDKELELRWKELFNLASSMADNEKIRTGTRYDALRILGADVWEQRGAQLVKYLGKGTHAELQQGAICGLIDIKSKEIAPVLIAHWAHFSEKNRGFVLDGLLRDEERISALLDAIESKNIASAVLGPEQAQQLKQLPYAKLRERAVKLLQKTD